jgi:drug/metabolite transporter (DMT)-like permease
MYLAIQWALSSFPAFFQMGTQFMLAGALLFLFSHLRGAPWPSARQWIGGAVFGFLMLGIGYGFTALAEASVSSGLVVAFIAVIPTFIALLEWCYGVRPGNRQLVGVLIGLSGIVMLSMGQGFQTSLGGLLAITISCVAWSIGSVWSVHGLPGGAKVAVAPGSMGYACQMLTGGIMLLVASRLAGEIPVWPPGTTALASWAYLMVAGSLISYTA